MDEDKDFEYTLSLENTDEENKAILSLERAFKKCAKLGLRFSVMDAELLYTNARLREACKVLAEKDNTTMSCSYPEAAYAQNTALGRCLEVNCYDSMHSCGGW